MGLEQEAVEGGLGVIGSGAYVGDCGDSVIGSGLTGDAQDRRSCIVWTELVLTGDSY